MRIMCVFFRFGKDLVGGAEIHFYRLAQTLAGMGHQVDVFTTRSLGLSHSRFGNAVWDNQFSPLPEQIGALNVYRFRVKNPRPAKAQRAAAKISHRFEKELASRDFATKVAGALEPGQGYLLGGWNELEEWEDSAHPVRWTERQATFVLHAHDMREVAILVYGGGATKARFELQDNVSTEFTLAPGEEKWISLTPQKPGPVVGSISVARLLKIKTDPRKLGIAVKMIRFVDGRGSHIMSLDSDYSTWLMQEPEERIAKVLWENALRRPAHFGKYQRNIVGPTSPQLRREAIKAAGEYDVVLANMIPMRTFDIAARAAAKARKPVLLFPLYHPRDPYHYWKHFHRDMEKADLVDSNSASVEEILRARGFRTECIGPGFDRAEFEGAEISGTRFRDKHGLNGEKILLFVGRKTGSKRYDLAAEAVRELRLRGWPARLVMIGPDEDKMSLLGEHILYLGKLDRDELLDAYDACDIFIMPSVAESFGMVVCEAWLLRKPVLGNRNCAAVASLIQEGRDGLLAATSVEFADRAEEILRDPALGRTMGENGYGKVLDQYTWDAVGAKCEALLLDMLT